MITRVAALLLASAGALDAATMDDVVFRRGAPPLACEVADVSNGQLRLRVSLRPDQPPATLSIPAADVEKIVFGERPEERQLLANPKAASLPALKEVWLRKEPFVGVENSDSGDFALAMAELLINSPSKTDVERAFELFKQIHAEDWSESRNALGQQGRLRAMIKLGLAEEAVAEARELAASSEDPTVLIEANYVLAEASFREFKELLENNPRWEEDEFVRPERHRLYHRTLDLLLFPYLFHGTETAQAARGLVRAIELLQLSGEVPMASELARDLTVLYPATAEAATARAFLETHKPKTPPNENTTKKT